MDLTGVSNQADFAAGTGLQDGPVVAVLLFELGADGMEAIALGLDIYNHLLSGGAVLQKELGLVADCGNHVSYPLLNFLYCSKAKRGWQCLFGISRPCPEMVKPPIPA